MRGTATVINIRISDLLSHGQENATSLRDLIAITGIDNRTLRQSIEKERREGVPVLSDNKNGYYLPASDEETAEFVRSMRHRAYETLATAAAVEAGIGKWREVT